MLESISITCATIQALDNNKQWVTSHEDSFLTLLFSKKGEWSGLHINPGSYSRIRIIVPKSVNGNHLPHNPGCFIKYKDGSTEHIFIPGGDDIGLIIEGEMTIKENGIMHLGGIKDLSDLIIKSNLLNVLMLKPVIKSEPIPLSQ